MFILTRILKNKRISPRKRKSSLYVIRNTREEIKPDDEARRIKSKKRRRRKRGEETREWIDSKGKFDSPFLLKPIDE